MGKKLKKKYLEDRKPEYIVTNGSALLQLAAAVGSRPSGINCQQRKSLNQGVSSLSVHV